MKRWAHRPEQSGRLGTFDGWARRLGERAAWAGGTPGGRRTSTGIAKLDPTTIELITWVSEFRNLHGDRNRIVWLYVPPSHPQWLHKHEVGAESACASVLQAAEGRLLRSGWDG